MLGPLGKGGMGEVYRARDTRLGREVAIKVLPSELEQNPERLARFEREARVLASLKHPNIATLHGFEHAADTGFLVMELIEGETLERRIARGALPWREAVALFEAIADGLKAAHESGIVHRDLKPANIKIDEEGRPKVLDFGLARSTADDVAAMGALSHSPTLTAGATVPGVLLGTAAYMAPEQARGARVDRRADVWAFGACLYEALTGMRAFHGEDTSMVLAAILTREPDWERLPTDRAAVDRRAAAPLSAEGHAAAAAGCRRRTVAAGRSTAVGNRARNAGDRLTWRSDEGRGGAARGGRGGGGGWLGNVASGGAESRGGGDRQLCRPVRGGAANPGPVGRP